MGLGLLSAFAFSALVTLWSAKAYSEGRDHAQRLQCVAQLCYSTYIHTYVHTYINTYMNARNGPLALKNKKGLGGYI